MISEGAKSKLRKACGSDPDVRECVTASPFLPWAVLIARKARRSRDIRSPRCELRFPELNTPGELSRADLRQIVGIAPAMLLLERSVMPNRLRDLMTEPLTMDYVKRRTEEGWIVA